MLAQRVLGSVCARPCLQQARRLAVLGVKQHESSQTTSRIFATASRLRRDDSKVRTIQHETERKTEAAESIEPETVQTEKPIGPSKQESLLSEQSVTNKEQRKADWAIIKDMAKYLWPKNDFGTRFRVSLSVGLLIGAKVDKPPCQIVHKCRCVDSLLGPERTSTILFQKHCRFHEHRLCCYRWYSHDRGWRNHLCL